MAIAQWGDYSAGYPGGSALSGAGFTGVIRYVGVGRPDKRITAEEYHDLKSHGVAVLLVAELGTRDAEGGYQAGMDNARTALADARRLGIPDDVGIAAAADEHLTPGQIAAAKDYVRGFRDVLGLNRTGAYGFSEFLNAVRAAGLATWYWKCGSAPTPSESTWVHFWQRNAGARTRTVNQVTVDINDQLLPIGIDEMTPDQASQLASVWNAVFFGGGDAGNESIIKRLENLEEDPDALAAVDRKRATRDTLAAIMKELDEIRAALAKK